MLGDRAMGQHVLVNVEVRFTGKEKGIEFWGWTTGWVHMVSKIITGDGRGWDEKGNSMSSAATSSEDKTCCKINCFQYVSENNICFNMTE